MKATIKTYNTNAILSFDVNDKIDNTYKSIIYDFQGEKFDSDEEYEEWIDEQLSQIKDYENYEDIRLSLKIATDHLRP